MANPFVHCELATSDVAKAKAFYGKLFDWKLEDVPMDAGHTYTMIGVGDGTGGGMMKQMIPDAPSMWMPYVLVDDIEAATQKARSIGRLSIFTDPTGAIIGLWQPSKKG